MLIEGCKHEIDVTVPVEEIVAETERVIAGLQKKVRLPGFRPGKAPAGLIRSKFASEVRQDVLESLVPKYLNRRFEADDVRVVGNPNIKDVHFHEGEPLRFKAEFEVAPVLELGEYRGIVVPYAEPVVTAEDVTARIDELREQKADYSNIEPRPAVEGDYAVVSLLGRSGKDEPVKQDELMLHVGDPETMPAFKEALLGMAPGEAKEFDVEYPDDYGQEKLAGKNVHFLMEMKGLRAKELPEFNDDFAKDLGDYQSAAELEEAVRKAIFQEREVQAQRDARNKIVDKLVETHEFAVPQVFVDKQIENELRHYLASFAERGVDVAKLNIDWAKLKESQQPKALHDVKASLLLDKIAEREAIAVANDEIDREVQRIARRDREPAAAVRRKLEKDGTLQRLAVHIRTEKTLAFLFEHARKEAPAEA